MRFQLSCSVTAAVETAKQVLEVGFRSPIRFVHLEIEGGRLRNEPWDELPKRQVRSVTIWADFLTLGSRGQRTTKNNTEGNFQIALFMGRRAPDTLWTVEQGVACCASIGERKFYAKWQENPKGIVEVRVPALYKPNNGNQLIQVGTGWKNQRSEKNPATI